jgi:undecaprenyl-diphosphatase
VNYRWLVDINNLAIGNPALKDVMVASAKYVIYGVFAALAVLALIELRRRNWLGVVAMAFSLGVAYLFGLLAARLHPEQRPFITHPSVHLLVPHPAGASFPSDHATAAFAIAFAVMVFISVRWGLLFLVAALLIGFARVFDGLHYPGDIGGGALVAALGVLAAMLLLRLRGLPLRTTRA